MWYDKYKEAKILVHRSESRAGSHNKFWYAHLDSVTSQVFVRWGRIGTKGQSQTKSFDSNSKAASFINAKYRQKTGKGYVNQVDGEVVDQAKFDQLNMEAALVGASNKLIKFKWLEAVGDDEAFVPIDLERLYSPECSPAIYVELETRKLYCGLRKFSLIFSGDRIYMSSDRIGSGSMPRRNCDEVSSGHDAYKFAQKAQEAIGASLAATS